MSRRHWFALPLLSLWLLQSCSGSSASAGGSQAFRRGCDLGVPFKAGYSIGSSWVYVSKHWVERLRPGALASSRLRLKDCKFKASPGYK